MNPHLHIHQEVLLLTLNDSDGNFSNSMIEYALAGAIISDLSLLGKIEISEDRSKLIRLTDDRLTGNLELDQVIDQIRSSKKTIGIQNWVSKIAQISGLKHKVARTLCEMGILKESTSKVLFVFTKKTYPEIDGSWEDAVRQRMGDVMFHPKMKADVRTAVLIAFAYHCDLLKQNFAPVELKQHKDRIKQLATNPSRDLASAEATQAAIQAANAAVMAAVIIPSVVAATAATS